MCVNSGTVLGVSERETMIHNDQVIHKQGSLKTTDKKGVPFLIEWQSDGMFADATIAKMAILWECARHAYVPVELDFLRSFPEVVGTEPYYKAFEPLFEQGADAVNWQQAATVMEGMLKNHFVIDLSKIPASVVAHYQHDQSIIVSIKDAHSNELLGFMTFMIRAEYPVGHIKAIAAGVLPSAQGRGLGKLMMSALFRIMPHIELIFLSTRVTNTTALHAYESWGFVRNDAPIQDPQHMFNLKHWVFMKYDAVSKDTLQKAAATLVAA
jgi:GNAT superfamily N-acetyltransferase